MLCEHHKDALSEAAASVLVPRGAGFEQEQALFAAIDAGLRVTANAEMPASLLPRVRARLNDLSVSPRFWVPAWAVLVMAAALLPAVVSLRGRRHDTALDPLKGALAHAPLPAETFKMPLGASPRTGPGSRMKKHSVQSRAQASLSVEQVAVLLPANQKAVTDAWLDGLQSGKLKANDWLAQKSDLPLENLRISPLDVSPIELKPLEDVSGGVAVAWRGSKTLNR